MRPIALIAAMLACQGCIVNVNRDRSIGQELIELQQARAAGTVSEPDYLATRQRLFDEAGAIIPLPPSMPLR